MADPITIMAVGGMAASAGAGAMGAFGSIFSGKAQSNQLTYQAGVARMNQTISKQNADYTRAVGEVQTQEAGMEGAHRISQIKTAQGASGVDVNSSSSQDVRSSQLDVTQENEAIIRANAAHRAYGHELEAFGEGETAKLHDIGAENVKKASYINAASSILGGASSVASKWSTYKTDFGNKGETNKVDYNWSTSEVE